MITGLTRSCSSLWLSGTTEENHTHIARPGKDQNSKLEVQFLLNVYCFHTVVKSRNCKISHCELGTLVKTLQRSSVLSSTLHGWRRLPWTQWGRRTQELGVSSFLWSLYTSKGWGPQRPPLDFYFHSLGVGRKGEQWNWTPSEGPVGCPTPTTGPFWT
jgi:hypothetical protein